MLRETKGQCPKLIHNNTYISECLYKMNIYRIVIYANAIYVDRDQWKAYYVKGKKEKHQWKVGEFL